ncbi:AMP-binding protein [Brevibacterium sp. 5221]|uniref:AMP-binding protein n=1 Tax=Brevibacterium rongguiense TaxID=2695267 RepID=A0A6N9H485_9MICO|nr:AMP-binding protein [Brevibacterium rongguiense]MYM18492.1 AMP-binding protein [Brevibacterium rongguiense]
MTADTPAPELRAAQPFDEPLGSRFPTAVAMWDAAVAEYGDVPFLYDFAQPLTFRELDERAAALAGALSRAGLGPGDRIALFAQNDPLFVAGLIAAWKIGGIAVPVNPMNTARELAYHLSDSGARALITLPGLFAEVARDVVVSAGLALTIVGGHREWRGDGTEVAEVAAPAELAAEPRCVLAEDVFADPPSVPAPPQARPDDVALLTYTSGTTGKPKGACNTHGNLAFDAEVFEALTGLRPGQPILGVAPLFHITGMVAHLMLGIRGAHPIALTHRFHPKAMLQAARAHRPVFTIGAITALMALADASENGPEDFAGLDVVYTGGAPVAPALADRLEGVFGAYVHNIFGMSETTSAAIGVPRDARAPVDPASGALSIGRPVYGTRVRVVGEDGRDCAAGEYGELLCAGPQVVPGYWERPEATQEAFDDGFLRTGDVGFADADGWIFLVDRKKDMINAAGYKVWPREVEDVIYGHPAISEAAVVGVADEYRGETVKAYVTLKEGAQASGEEIVDYCRANMAAYKYPRSVEVLEQLPKTATGKILRRELRSR